VFEQSELARPFEEWLREHGIGWRLMHIGDEAEFGIVTGIVHLPFTAVLDSDCRIALLGAGELTSEGVRSIHSHLQDRANRAPSCKFLAFGNSKEIDLAVQGSRGSRSREPHLLRLKMEREPDARSRGSEENSTEK